MRVARAWREEVVADKGRSKIGQGLEDGSEWDFSDCLILLVSLCKQE